MLKTHNGYEKIFNLFSDLCFFRLAIIVWTFCKDMKIILRLIAIVTTAAVASLGILFLFPSYYRVARSTQIEASVKTVYDNLADFQKWGRWNVWDQRVGQAHSTTSTPSQGIGAWHDWKDSVNGDVMAMFTYQESDQALFYRLRFNDRGIVAIGSFQLQPEGQGTHVTWTVSDRLGMNPLKRWNGLFLALNAGEELDHALRNLKRVCENRTALSRQESVSEWMATIAANDSH
jgi:hypothetical protein